MRFVRGLTGGIFFFVGALLFLVLAIPTSAAPNPAAAAASPATNPAKAYLKRGIFFLKSSDYKSALGQFDQCLNLAVGSNDETDDVDAVSDIGVVYTDLGQYGKALTYANQALDLDSSAHDAAGEGSDFGNIGNLCGHLGKYRLAIASYLKSMAIAVKLGDIHAEAWDFDNIGNADESLSQYALALLNHQKSLALANQIGDTRTEEHALGNIGVVYRDQANYDLALQYFNQSLTIATNNNDVSGEEEAYDNIGTIDSSKSQYDDALASYQKASAIATSIGDSEGEEGILNNIGNAYENEADYKSALDAVSAALALSTKIGDVSGEEYDLGDLGVIYMDLAEYNKVVACDLSALVIAEKIGDVQKTEHDLGNLALVYQALNLPGNATVAVKRSLALSVKIGDTVSEASDYLTLADIDESGGQYEQALILDQTALGLDTKRGDPGCQARDLGEIGIVYNKLRRYRQALTIQSQALNIDKKTGDLSLEDRCLTDTGNIYTNLGQSELAISYYHQALLLQVQIGDLEAEATDLANLMNLEARVNRPDLAIYYGKRSVNTYQAIRSGIASLSVGAQNSFLSKVETAYHSLANLLIDQGRLPEAEQVLAFLKGQECIDYVQRDAAIWPMGKPVSFDQAESSANSTETNLEDPVINIGRQLEALETLTHRTPDEVQQIITLQSQLSDARAAYTQYVDAVLPTELTASPSLARPDVTNIAPIQAQLRAMGPGTVAVITLVEPDYLREIFITGSTQKVEQSNISAVDLRKLVGKWRAALQNPVVDPRPLGQQLAGAIIGPIQADLNGDQATTILFSLDDILRFVPMAALYDGKQYLTEKYRTALFTGATLTARQGGDSPSDWNTSSQQTLLALGVTQSHVVDDPATGTELNFPALPGVAREINEIARTSTNPNGILSGEALEDDQFTVKSLQIALATGYPVVHIASHFDLGANDKSSFLLLGDGTPYTLDKLFDQGGNIFQGVDLLTLSACQTGEDIGSSDGHQFESLAMVAEAQGANSILASLWPVSDLSTPLLMRAFYSNRAIGSGMTKAEALREAQMAMIDGGRVEAAAEPGKPSRSAVALPTAGSADQPSFTPNPKAPYAHPYYWAPFVLIGDWK